MDKNLILGDVYLGLLYIPRGEASPL